MTPTRGRSRLGVIGDGVKVNRSSDGIPLSVELATSLVPALPEILARLKNLFDLSARPDVIAGHLSVDARLAACRHAVLGFGCPVRSTASSWRSVRILGQRIRCERRRLSRAAWRTALASRSRRPAGTDRSQPHPGTAGFVELADLTALGIAARRQKHPGHCPGHRRRRDRPGTVCDPEAVISKLQTVPGIGDWTAQYIAMRALRCPMPSRPATSVCSRRAARHQCIVCEMRPKRGAPGVLMRPSTSGKASTSTIGRTTMSDSTCSVRYSVFSSPIGDLMLTADGESLTGLYMCEHKGRPATGPEPSWQRDDSASSRTRSISGLL